jgi:hypothetical protein
MEVLGPDLLQKLHRDLAGGVRLLVDPHPLVFLDVDGVLHSEDDGDAEENRGVFQPRCMKQLQRLVLGSGVRLVLSSTWRESPATTRLVERKLQQWGMGVAMETEVGDGDEGGGAAAENDASGSSCSYGELIGSTPDHGAEGCRGGEILEWLREHGHEHGAYTLAREGAGVRSGCEERM